MGDHRFPGWTGWVLGYGLGAVLGAVTWVLSKDPAIAVVVFAGTGSPFGVAFEEGLDTRPLPPRQRRIALGTCVGIVLVGTAVLTAVLLQV